MFVVIALLHEELCYRLMPQFMTFDVTISVQIHYEVFLLSVLGWILCEAIFSYHCSSEMVPVYVSIVMCMSLESNKFMWHCVST